MGQKGVGEILKHRQQLSLLIPEARLVIVLIEWNDEKNLPVPAAESWLRSEGEGEQWYGRSISSYQIRSIHVRILLPEVPYRTVPAVHSYQLRVRTYREGEGRGESTSVSIIIINNTPVVVNCQSISQSVIAGDGDDQRLLRREGRIRPVIHRYFICVPEATVVDSSQS